MKARFLLVLFVLVFLTYANAQDRDRVQVFGGYTYVGYYAFPAYQGPWTLNGFNGLETSVSVKLVPHVAAEGDFGLGYGSAYAGGLARDKTRTYMGGPRVFAGFGKASFFGHVLFGALTYESTFKGSQGIPPSSSSQTSTAMAFGGGADYWLSRHFGARLIQADYIHNTNHEVIYVGGPGSHANFRISTGIVFRF